MMLETFVLFSCTKLELACKARLRENYTAAKLWYLKQLSSKEFTLLLVSWFVAL